MTADGQEALGIRVFDLVSVTDDVAEAYPDLVVKFLEVTDGVARCLKEHPYEARPIIAKASGMEPEASNEVLALFEFPTREERRSKDWLGGGVQAFTKEVADFFVQQGQMPEALDDYPAAFDASFYERAKE